MTRKQVENFDYNDDNAIALESLNIILEYFSQKEIADSFCVNPSTVSRWANGIRTPSDKMITKLLDIVDYCLKNVW